MTSRIYDPIAFGDRPSCEVIDNNNKARSWLMGQYVITPKPPYMGHRGFIGGAVEQQ